MNTALAYLAGLLKTEPTRVFGVLRVVLAASVVLGLHVSVEQKAAWLSIIAAIEGLFTSQNRAKVVPSQTIEDAGHSVADIKADAKANREAGTT